MIRALILLMGLVGAVYGGVILTHVLPVSLWLAVPACLLVAGLLLGLVPWLMPGVVSWKGLLTLDGLGAVGILIAYRVTEVWWEMKERQEGEAVVKLVVTGLFGVVGACAMAFAVYATGLQLGAWVRSQSFMGSSGGSRGSL